MKRTIALLVAVCVNSLVAAPAILHDARNRDGSLTLNEMNFTLPSGWTLVQDGLSDQTTILALAKGDQYVTLFAKPKSSAASLPSMYTADSQGPSTTASESYGPLTWQARDTSHTAKKSRGTTYYVHGFQTQFGGYSYYGFSRATSADIAKQGAKEILSTMRVPLRGSRSITSADYKGHKYYLGWGTVAGQEIPEMMNEVKYDVKHTNDIFTQAGGGSYAATTLLEEQVSLRAVSNQWSQLKNKMTADDMYVQYSSGHGYATEEVANNWPGPMPIFGQAEGGLALSETDLLGHDRTRDSILALPAREIIVFTMACFSGSLVDSFNRRKSDWQNWQSAGRTLFVLASSASAEESSTGPGTDPSEPGGPDGSAGSAFGHALWKALIGEADGYVDGVKDGFLSLEEIRDYTTARTQEIGNHTPVATGAYNGPLIMNKVPSKAFVEALEREGGTKGLSDAQVMERVQRLDAELGVR